MADPYIPPDGDKVGLNFIGGYTPPAGDVVALEFAQSGVTPGDAQYLFPEGEDHSAFGAPSVHNQHELVSPSGFTGVDAGVPTVYLYARYISPAGIVSKLAFGTATLINWNKNVYPTGISAFAAGQPQVWNYTRIIFAGNIVAPTFTGPAVELWQRYVSPPGYAATLYGTAAVTHGIRTVAPSSINAAALGSSAWVSFRVRSVAPSGIGWNFSTNPVIGWSRSIAPWSWDAQQFGARIIPESQTAYPQSFAEQWGLASVWNYNSIAAPAGFMSMMQEQYRWGRAEVFNLRQYVTVLDTTDSGLHPPTMEGWTSIENRNRVVETFGVAPGAFYGPLVENAARALVALVWDSQAFDAPMIAAAVRPLDLDGIDSLVMSGWGAIYNDARVLAPAGWSAQAAGIAAVESNLQTFKGPTAFDSAAFGSDGLVAFAIRWLDLDGRGTEPPAIQLPVVDLHKRYVESAGLNAFSAGNAYLEVHWTIIAPKSLTAAAYGEPRVRNLTPELGGYGHDSQDYGSALVRLQWRPVNVQGDSLQLFGLAKIADRKQHIALSGADCLRIGDKLVATRLGSDPPSLQAIWFNVNDNNNFSNFIRDQVPAPSMNQKVLYVQGFERIAWGSVRVTANTIRVEPGYFDLLVGEPMVSARIRGVTVAEWPDSSVFQPSRADVTPRTVWAVMEAPQQAKLNHPSDNLHYVNSDGGTRTPGVAFGDATITLRHRRVNPSSAGSIARYGIPSAYLKRRYVGLVGFSALRSGVHTLPGEQEASQFDSSYTSVFGTASVVSPYHGPQTVKSTGWSASVIGTTDAQLFNRAIQVVGLSSMAMGASGSESYGGYTWQRLHVGPPMPVKSVGTDMQDFGATWPSLRVRELGAVGFDPFLSAYTLSEFDKRMRVGRINEAGEAPARLYPIGLSGFESGAPDAMLHTQYIRPDGNAEQYRKGVF